MKHTVLTMDVFLNPLSEDLGLIMESAPQYCSKLTIDGYDVPVENSPKTLFTKQAPYYKGEGYYHVEYYLRKGTAIPGHSFRHKTFKSFIIPEGVKRIKDNAFVGCAFALRPCAVKQDLRQSLQCRSGSLPAAVGRTDR